MKEICIEEREKRSKEVFLEGTQKNEGRYCSKESRDAENSEFEAKREL